MRGQGGGSGKILLNVITSLSFHRIIYICSIYFKIIDRLSLH